MACEVPVVAANRNGPAETLGHGGGILVRPDNVDDFTRAAIYYLKNREAAVRAGSRGREQILKRYALEQSARNKPLTDCHYKHTK